MIVPLISIAPSGALANLFEEQSFTNIVFALTALASLEKSTSTIDANSCSFKAAELDNLLKVSSPPAFNQSG